MRTAARSAFALQYWCPCVFALGISVLGAEWTQYRGPYFDGSTRDSVRVDWNKTPPKTVWKVPLDPALSSLSASAGKVFTMVRRRVGSEDREFLIALDGKTGRELWSTNLDLADYPDGGVGNDDGPRSTPTVEGDRVYVFSTYLRLHCLNRDTGALLWSRDFVTEFNAPVAHWQNASSPLLVGDLLLVNGNAPGGRLFGIRKTDGTTAWRNHDDAMTQATPVFATIAGRPQVVFFTQSGLVSVVPETGAQLWRHPFNFSTSTAASPVIAGDRVYCSAAYGVGAATVRIQDNGSSQSASQVWRTRGANQNHWATSIEHEGYLYGIFGQSIVSLRCIDMANGQQVWAQSGIGRGGIIKMGDRILGLTESGDLIQVAFNSGRYEELARFGAVRGKCWNIPIVSDGRIYARSTTEAVCLDIAASAPATPLQLLAGLRPDGGIEIVATSSEGPIESSRAGRVNLLFSDSLESPAWNRVPMAPIAQDGKLLWREPTPLAPSRRYYRTSETP